MFTLTRFTREQAKKATDMHPKMSAEAERMLAKLRVTITSLSAFGIVTLSVNRLTSAGGESILYSKYSIVYHILGGWSAK